MSGARYKGEEVFNGHELFTSFLTLWIHRKFFTQGLPEVDDTYVLHNEDARYASAFQTLCKHVATFGTPSDIAGVSIYTIDYGALYTFHLGAGPKVVFVRLISIEQKLTP
ncbi:MAG: hypothetical protein Q7R83_01895 [bacterium]|nr:hypothetical protein [bacterium]